MTGGGKDDNDSKNHSNDDIEWCYMIFFFLFVFVFFLDWFFFFCDCLIAFGTIFNMYTEKARVQLCGNLLPRGTEQQLSY